MLSTADIAASAPWLLPGLWVRVHVLERLR